MYVHMCFVSSFKIQIYYIYLVSVDGGWSNWKLDRLGECSVTCGVGNRRRYLKRTCTNPSPHNGGKDCETESKRIEIEACDAKVKCAGISNFIVPLGRYQRSFEWRFKYSIVS